MNSLCKQDEARSCPAFYTKLDISATARKVSFNRLAADGVMDEGKRKKEEGGRSWYQTPLI
jgi:predicted ArsR family transcriptional regulator